MQPFLWKDKRRGGFHILSHGTNTGDDDRLDLSGESRRASIRSDSVPRQPQLPPHAPAGPVCGRPGGSAGPPGPVRGCQPGPEGDCGRHFFSASGNPGTWAAAPLPREENGGCAFWRMGIPFADGRKYTFWRRERPHLAFEADGETIAALTSGVLDAPVFGNEQQPCDATYTMLQAVARG
eukprot:SAG22_NODE_928_length_6464_cov_2.852789_3_plen_180_part_00